ncbi:MAG: gliding motility-associated C-terminal domain-containing protein [Crocinitomicaceae bacterium]
MKSIVRKLDRQVGALDPTLNPYPIKKEINRSIAYGLILLLSLFFLNNVARATHVVGGGITYAQLENNNYLLTVKLYRDCSPGTAQLPGNVNVQCRRGNNGSVPPGISSMVLPLNSVTQIQSAIPACAFDPGVCVEEAIYQSVVNIPPGQGGYHLYYTICCRNGTINNIVNPLNAQETFYAYIPDNSTLTSGENSSPYFTDVPPLYVCAGQSLDLSFAANDIDGDSLVYYFYTPFDGQNNGGISYGAGAPPNNINISPVNWQAGFSANDPLDPNGGFAPGLTIDNTGFISGNPPVPGQYVVGVMVDEYRDGVLIGRISRDFQFNVINCPPPLDADISTTGNCNGLNIDFLNLSTGQNPTAWWNFGTNNPADSSVQWQPSFSYPAPGSYTVTLILAKGTACADTATYQVDVLDPVVFNVNVDSVSCNGFTDGAAQASANDPLYSYTWSTQQTGNSISNLVPGNYWVHATNTLGCVDTQTFVVNQPLPLGIQFNKIQPLCNGDQNGEITALVSGGTAPYNYYWTFANQNGNPVQNIGAGQQNVQVTDANGCIISANTSLGEPTALNAVPMAINDVSCFGFADGSVNVFVSGGSPGYNIDWLTLPNDNFSMSNLSAGTYIAEVTDANGCLEIVNITILEPDTFYVDIVVINEETCSGANGEAFADVTNGIGNITFQWSPGGQTNALTTGLSAGPIQVIVQDENGCTDQANGVIIDNPTGVASMGNITPVSCSGGSDGSAEVLMNGGTAPFIYNWSCNCPTNVNVASNLSAGNYFVNVVDNNGCSDSIAFVIDELPALQVNVISMTEPLCNGDANGSIEAAAAGGTAPYHYVWNSAPAQNTALAVGLSSGQYMVTVTDDNGCIAQTDTFLNQPTPLVAQAQVLGNIICYGDNSGVASAQGNGGIAPYSYYWIQTGETTQQINNLVAGIYKVNVTDANGCVASDEIEIIQYDSVSAEIIYPNPFCPGDLVDFYVSTNGLNNQYDYYWYVNQQLQATTNTFSFVINDTSTVSIELVNIGNCPTVTDTVTIEPVFLQAGVVNALATPDTICYGSSTTISAVIVDTSFITASFWNDPLMIGLGPHVVSPDTTQEYVITVQNMCGQQQSDTIKINVFTPPHADILTSGLSGCDAVQVDFSYTYEAYDYAFQGAMWNINFETYDVVTPQVTFESTSAVIAKLYLSFANGCTFEYNDNFAVTVFESPDADFYYNPDPALVNEITEFVDISHGNPKVWEWYVNGQFVSNEERPSHIFTETGEQSVLQIIFDENGCTDTMHHVVEVIGDFMVYVPNAFTPDGNGVNNTFRPILTEVDPDGYEFLIFNRWGEVIYQTYIINDSWDGTYLGENVRDGVYIWKVIVTDNVGLEHEYVGHVTLLR